MEADTSVLSSNCSGLSLYKSFDLLRSRSIRAVNSYQMAEVEKVPNISSIKTCDNSLYGNITKTRYPGGYGIRLGHPDQLASTSPELSHSLNGPSSKYSMDAAVKGQDNLIGKVFENSVENLMRFAEILYKCTLCTTLPSILTSKDSFINHVNDQHLTKKQSHKDCQHCNLKFGTEEDLRAHLDYAHQCRQQKQSSECSQDCSKEIKQDNQNDKESTVGDSENSNTFLECSKPVQNHSHRLILDTKQKPVPASPSKDNQKTDKMTMEENISRLQLLADQILMSNSRLHAGGTNSGHSGLTMNPSYTQEFGKYTKLIREGGNIVYFCQVCNCKCQVRAAFQSHCASLQHRTRAETAERTVAEQQKIIRPSNFKTNLFVTKQTSTGDSVKSDCEESSSTGKDQCSDGAKVGSDEDTEKDGKVNQDSDGESHYDRELTTRHRRKRPMPIAVRNQPRASTSWSDSESEDDYATKKKLCTNLAVGEKDSRQPLEDVKDNGRAPPTPDQKLNNFCIPEKQAESSGDRNYSNTDSLGMLNSVVESFLVQKKSSTTSQQTNKSLNDNLLWSKTTTPIVEKEESGLKGLYRCSFCEFVCNDIRDYEEHFEKEHDSDILDSSMSDASGKTVQGEYWKMLKIKDILPELLCGCSKGYVSRDLLLQKISMVLNIPEIIHWGPACNKAVREEFPNSLAQRKGKFKNYYFGVALIEQLQEQEDLSDSENVTYQPLRDLSQDLEKILQFLPELVYWTGDLDAGISRDEVLHFLGERIDEPGVQYWGVQCNRAMRFLFPGIQMKRKVYFGVDFIKNLQRRMLGKASGDDSRVRIKVEPLDEEFDKTAAQSPPYQAEEQVSDGAQAKADTGEEKPAETVELDHPD